MPSPGDYVIFFRKDRCLLGELSRVAYECIREVLGEVSRDKKAGPGAIISVHTAGNLLNFYPQLHGMVTRGGFSADGTFLPVPRIPSRVLTRVFAHHILAMLKKEGKIDEGIIRQMQGWKHSGSTGYGAALAHSFKVATYLSAWACRYQGHNDLCSPVP